MIIKIIILLTIFALLLVYLFLSANNGIINDNGLKGYYLSLFPKHLKLNHKILSLDDNGWENVINKLKYPSIFKPDDCSGKGKNVEMIQDKIEALEYIKKSKNCTKKILVQDYCDLNKEFSVLYERYPLSKKGYVKAIIEKNPLKKHKTFLPLNMKEADGTRRTTVVDHTNFITDKFSNLIDGITQNVPNLLVGRYDIKAKSLKHLLDGEFKILELNNLFAGDTRCYVDTINFFDKYNYKIQLRWILKRIACGLQNHMINNHFNITKNMFISIQKLCQSDYYEILDVLKIL